MIVREAQLFEAGAATGVHLAHQFGDRSVAARDALGVHAARSQQDQPVEDFGVESSGVSQRIVAALDRLLHARVQGGVVLRVAAQVRHPEGHVARFVLRREAHAAIPLDNQRPAEFVFEGLVKTLSQIKAETDAKERSNAA